MVLNVFFSFGEYDEVIILEAPDDFAAAARAMVAASNGHLEDVKTTLLTVDETVEGPAQGGSRTESRAARRQSLGPATPDGRAGS